MNPKPYGEREPDRGSDMMQGEMIAKEVQLKIADKLAESGINDLDAVLLDPLFLQAKNMYEVEAKIFKSFILTELKANVSERDLELFMKSHPKFSHGLLISKIDVIQAFKDVFQTAIYK